MNLQKIEELLRKYEQGETSLRDERVLRSFFEKEEVPFHLRGYRELFRYFRSAGKEEIPDPKFDEKLRVALEKADEKVPGKTKVKRLYIVFAAAACLVILIGLALFLQNRTPRSGTFDDPQMAYAETKKVLMLVSNELNEGMHQMNSFREFQTGMDNLSNVQSFQDGLKNLKKISVLDKSKDIITQKTKSQ